MRDPFGDIPSKTIFAVSFESEYNTIDPIWSVWEKAFSIGGRAEISNGTISIDLDAEIANILEASSTLGLPAVCDAIAIEACEKFHRVYGQEFLLSDLCVSNEIEEHIVAYLWTTGERLLPNLLATSFVSSLYLQRQYSSDSVYNATRMTDMRESDVVTGGLQALFFNYRNGIRACYIGTSRDPWADCR